MAIAAIIIDQRTLFRYEMKVQNLPGKTINTSFPQLSLVTLMGMTLKIQCRDCGNIRMAEFNSPILPLIDGSCCAGTAEDSKKCGCGCEAFYVLETR